VAREKGRSDRQEGEEESVKSRVRSGDCIYHISISYGLILPLLTIRSTLLAHHTPVMSVEDFNTLQSAKSLSDWENFPSKVVHSGVKYAAMEEYATYVVKGSKPQGYEENENLIAKFSAEFVDNSLKKLGVSESDRQKYLSRAKDEARSDYGEHSKAPAGRVGDINVNVNIYC